MKVGNVSENNPFISLTLDFTCGISNCLKVPFGKPSLQSSGRPSKESKP